MKKLLPLMLMPGVLFAQNGVNMLIGNDHKMIQSNMVVEQKQLVLDDHFLVQFYGSFMAARVTDKDFSDWTQMVLSKKFQKALENSYSIKINTPQKKEIVSATRLYLMWKLGLNQSFFNEWLHKSVTSNFLHTPFAIALDQIVGANATDWILKNNIYLTSFQKKALSKIESNNTKFNTSVQAFFNMRKGEKSLGLIGRLSPTDPLRLKLADSAILAFARKGELAKSAKILKEVYEPVIVNEKDINKISAYYLKLARMLYQARAFEAANYYYELIPDEAQQFLTARVEKMWISMQKNDLAQIRGDMHTLSQNIFQDKFIPEIYLVSAMANLKMCQFKEVEKNFADFIQVNKLFLKDIETNINAKSPAQIIDNDFYANYMKRSIQQLTHENDLLKSKFIKLPAAKAFMTRNADLKQVVIEDYNKELRRKWKNRKILLESTIRKMRFVKVELLSTMRRLNSQLAQIKYSDEVQLTSSALDKSDKLSFKYDGVLFGDELFNYTSDLKNLCLRGRK